MQTLDFLYLPYDVDYNKQRLLFCFFFADPYNGTMIRLFKTMLIVVVIFFLAWFYLSKTYPQTPPQTSVLYFLEHSINPHVDYKNYVIGFLPYWKMDQIQNIEPNK